MYYASIPLWNEQYGTKGSIVPVFYLFSNIYAKSGLRKKTYCTGSISGDLHINRSSLATRCTIVLYWLCAVGICVWMWYQAVTDLTGFWYGAWGN